MRRGHRKRKDRPRTRTHGIKKKETRMSQHGYCPHGHPVAEITLPGGMKQAIGGAVGDKICPLCVESGWKGIPYTLEPVKPTFVSNCTCGTPKGRHTEECKA